MLLKQLTRYEVPVELTRWKDSFCVCHAKLCSANVLYFGLGTKLTVLGEFDLRFVNISALNILACYNVSFFCPD